MLLAQKVINRGSYVHISHYFDSIESLIESVYFNELRKEKLSYRQKVWKNISKLLDRIRLSKK